MSERRKQVIKCCECEKPMYRTDGYGVFLLNDDAELLDERDGVGLVRGATTPPGDLSVQRIKPISITVGIARFIVCSRACAVKGLETLEESVLYSGGYPLGF